MGSFLSQHPTVAEQSSIDTLTDDDLQRLILGRRHEDAIHEPDEWNDLMVGDSVWRIAPDAVVKRTRSQTEAFMMAYVSSHTSIPIPKVRRVLTTAHVPDMCSDVLWVVMDYVQGQTLESSWRKMSWWSRFKAMWSLRRYIRELQATPLPTPERPGPFDGTGASYLCKGHYFTEDGAGPFRSYGEMGAWYDRRRFDTKAAMHDHLGLIYPCPKFDASHPLVLCHMDLHMRNIIVDDNGKLWLVDWERAGAFPPWLEYAHLVTWGGAAREELRPPKWWLWGARFMIGNYRKYTEAYLDRMYWSWQRSNYDVYPLDYLEKLGLSVD